MTRKSFWAWASLGVAWMSLPLPGCGSSGYLYTPSTTTLTSADPAQTRTAVYPFPPDSPHGEIRLATSGIARTSENAPGAVRVRLTVRNRSQEKWVLDKREQNIVLAATRDVEPFATATAVPSPPLVVAVLPDETATIDLAFILPAAASTASEIPAFDAVWTVHVGARDFTTKTTFERLVVPSVARDVPAAGYPFNEGNNQVSPPAGERLPGTNRWTDTVPIPERGLQ